MYEDGLVYRDKRIINQCPECRTALADIDTEHEKRRGIFAYIRYPLIEEYDMSGIKAVVLDLHRVIGTANESRDKRFREFLDVTQEELSEKFFGSLKKYFISHEKKFEVKDFWDEIKGKFNISDEKVETLKEIWATEFDLEDGLLNFLDRAEENDLKIAILSNGYSEWAKVWLKETYDRFDAKVFSGDLDCKGKPFKEIYRKVEKELGVNSNEIFFIDDRQEFVEAANRYGWNAIRYTNYEDASAYLFEGRKYITVATTRPETMLGDTAVAVNPEDDRYKEYIGKKVLLPIANREIPIIGDEDVDMEKGTGAVKVTPAHSPIDFDLGQKHDLEIVNVINEEGKMTGDIPEKFKGMGTIECSKALCAELDEQGLLEKIENIHHEVAVCERCRTPIEPIISNQWYIDVSDLAKKALEELEEGSVRVLPEGQQRALEHFYENIEPWCISRQLWWGQRIPIWYSGSKKLHDWLMENDGKSVEDFEKEFNTKIEGDGSIYVGENKPEKEGDWEAETDMFDTWFSSGQWPYSTLGGPGKEDYDKYYPTQLMIHARDILFWWSARMIMMGLYRTKRVPYPQIFLTGMILAEDGSKMSKSKGNGVEPKEVFDKYGADALRLWYYSDALPGSNAPLREEKIKGNRNFVNKIWNASRFIIMNIEEEEIEEIVKFKPEQSLERVKATREHIKKVSEYIERYQFNLGAEAIREFFWHSLCDVWIEQVKDETQEKEVGSEIRIEKLGELLYLLKENLRIMHPFVPFVTEAVWQELVNLGLAKGMLMEQQIEI
jgi:HAD superfamily hydrolase (TIGR01509 family)